MKITKEGVAVVERDSHLGKWVQEWGRLDFDQHALKTYLNYFKDGGVMLNVGANIGCYAKAFVDKAKKVICFEPNKEAHECLVYNLGKYDNVDIHNLAVSMFPHKYKVKCDNDNIGMAYIEKSDDGEFETTTIDSLSLTELDFILMDCEGFELDVLKGGEKTINELRPIMVIEINTHTLKRVGVDKSAIFDWLRNHKYSYRNIFRNANMDGDQFDIICMNA